MRYRNQKSIVEYLCCLLMINLLAAPITHASMMPVGSADPDSESTPHCEQMAAATTIQFDLAVSMDEQPQCDHGNTCKLLCGVAGSIFSVDTAKTGFNRSTRWLPAIAQQLNDSHLSRLDRPPRL